MLLFSSRNSVSWSLYKNVEIRIHKTVISCFFFFVAVWNFMPITEGRTWIEYVWQSSTEENIWALEKRTRGWRQPNEEFGNFNYNTSWRSVWGRSWSTWRKYPATHANRLKNTTPQGGQNSNLYLWHRTITAWMHEWMVQNSWACTCYLCLIIHHRNMKL